MVQNSMSEMGASIFVAIVEDDAAFLKNLPAIGSSFFLTRAL